MRRFADAIGRYRALGAKLQEATAEDQREIDEIAVWMRDRMALLLDPASSFEDLKDLPESANGKVREAQICRNPRAADVANKIFTIVGKEIVPMARSYVELAESLRLPSEYVVFVSRVNAAGSDLKEQARLASKAVTEMQALDEKPKVCDDLLLLASLASTAGLLKEARRATSELDGLGVDRVLESIQTAEVAANYLRDSRRMITEVEALFNSYLGANDISEASRVASIAAPAIETVLYNANATSFLEVEERRALVEQARASLARINRDANERLGDLTRLKGIVLVRARALHAAGYRIDRNLPAEADRVAWDEVKSFLGSDLGMDVRARFHMRNLPTKDEIYAYDKLVAEGERRIKPFQGR
jgi:hypothetical protein